MRKVWTGSLLFLLTVLFLSLIVSADPELCFCGREYYAVTGDGHSQYDCRGCGQNYRFCKCHTCWCGKSLTVQSGENGEILSMICDGCGLPGSKCTCADREYYHALLMLDRNICGPDLPKTGGLLLLAAAILPAGLFFLLFLLFHQRNESFDAQVRDIGRLKVAFNQIEKQEDALSRYRVAKKAEEHKRRDLDGSPTPTDWKEWKALCFKKDSLLPSVLNEETFRARTEQLLQDCLTDSRLALSGEPDLPVDLWSQSGTFSPERLSLGAATPAGTLLRWPGASSEVCLYQIAAALCGPDTCRLAYGTGRTGFSGAVFEPSFKLLKKKEDWQAQTAECEHALAVLVPGGDPELLSKLPLCSGEFPEEPGLPPVTEKYAPAILRFAPSGKEGDL